MSETNSAETFDWKFYRYDPSLVAAIVFIVLFAISSFFHLYQLIRTRTWYFIPFVVGGLFQFIGYIGRAFSSKETPDWTLGPYIIQTLLILVAPALYAASIYMILGRIIQLVDGEAHSLIRLRWLTKLFVTGDVVSFTLQMAGGGVTAGATVELLKLGEKIVLGGLFVQIVFFGFFIIVATIFHLRLIKVPTPEAMSPAIPWRKHLHALYAASILIMIRSIFRVIEYIQGNNGYLLQREIFLYVFDAALMLAVMVIFNLIHPSEVKALLRGGKVSKGLKMYSIEQNGTSRHSVSV